MNSALQNRLVGTIIVVALVVIVLPEILDGEKTNNSQEFVDIPSPPDSLVIEAPEKFMQQTLDEKVSMPVEIVNETPIDDVASNKQETSDQKATGPANASQSSEQIANVATQSLTKPEVAAPAEPEIEIEVKDSGWVVQLGSFRYEKNVNELIATLKQAGYRAYSRPVQTNVGVLNKVFVGPELERARLEQALPHLQELTKLKGKITAFEVSAE